MSVFADRMNLQATLHMFTDYLGSWPDFHLRSAVGRQFLLSFRWLVLISCSTAEVGSYLPGRYFRPVEYRQSSNFSQGFPPAGKHFNGTCGMHYTKYIPLPHFLCKLSFLKACRKNEYKDGRGKSYSACL